MEKVAKPPPGEPPPKKLDLESNDWRSGYQVVALIMSD